MAGNGLTHEDAADAAKADPTGSTAFLRQAHRNNWQRYLAALDPAGPAGRRGWDLILLTASDDGQAAAYRWQLDWRGEAGLLPATARFAVVPDPGGRRIGSGRATLAGLAEARDSQRTLIIHSGGDSKRLPHCSAPGKLFARVPRTLPDGRASTVFDEFLISLAGLAELLPPGALVASGDVLLVFDHLQLTFARPGVAGVAAATPVEMGLKHGVYVTDAAGHAGTGREGRAVTDSMGHTVTGGGAHTASGGGDHRVVAYLHKPGRDELEAWGAIRDGTVQLDTGLVWFDGPTIGRLLRLAEAPGIQEAPLNLYGDLLLPLSASTDYDAYLADTSDGPATPAVQAARRVIWDRLRGTPFTVERLEPAVFVHFGSSAEYWRMAAGDPSLAGLCGWEREAASYATDAACDKSWVLINAAVEAPCTPGPVPLLVTDSLLTGELSWEGAGIIAGVHSTQPIRLPAGTVLDQLPLEGCVATRLFGLYDDPKAGPADGRGTFLNRPWAEWLAASGITPETLWPGMDPARATLWNARLFPCHADREESLVLALPLADPAAAPPGWREHWERAERTSLGQSYAQSDRAGLLAETTGLEEHVAARRFLAGVAAERPAAAVVPLLGRKRLLAGSAARAGQWLAAADPLLQMRGYFALGQATGDPGWTDRAFETLAAMIAGATIAATTTPTPAQAPGAAHAAPPAIAARQATGNRARAFPVHRVAAAARIDLGGGWTDTPPYSIERGGTVLNAALTLNGVHPIFAEAALLPEPRLVLESRDLDVAIEPRTVGEVLRHADPSDPFSLHKASLVLSGIVPPDTDPAAPLAEVLARLGGGVRLTTGASIPRGSGLGTSSILAGAVLASLERLLADLGLSRTLTQQAATRQSELQPAERQNAGARQAWTPDIPRLFDQVLCLEQMLTTGGGWQDQAGGLTGGIKLVTTRPGLPQRLQVAPVELSPAVRAELGRRLMLVYTGQQRLAKDLLRHIMGRWMARDPEMVWILDEIARLAVAMRDALLAGDVDGFGALLGEHWEVNKRMDPGCTNPFIDGLFETMRPCIHGGKLAGAGGGGFAFVIGRGGDCVEALSAALARRYPGTRVAVWPCAIPVDGVRVEDNA